ncbi:unnamed protein product [Ascophyllum nodosum]
MQMELNSGMKVVPGNVSTKDSYCQNSAGPVPCSTWDYTANTSRQDVWAPMVVAAGWSAPNPLTPTETSPSASFESPRQKGAFGQLASQRSFNGPSSVMTHRIDDSLAASPVKKSRSSHFPNASLGGHSAPASGEQSRWVDWRRIRAGSPPSSCKVPPQQQQKQQKQQTQQQMQQHVKQETKERHELQEQVSGVNCVIRPEVSALHAQGTPPCRSSGDIRRNCDHCVKKKVKCSGNTPCNMCRRKGLTCIFSLKQKPGPKVEKVRSLDTPPIEQPQHRRVYLASSRSRSQQRHESLRQHALPCEKQKQYQQPPQPPPQQPQLLQQPRYEQQQHTLVMEDPGQRDFDPPGYVPGAYGSIYRRTSGTFASPSAHFQFHLPSPINNAREADAVAGCAAQGVHLFEPSIPVNNNAEEANAVAGRAAQGVYHSKPSMPVPTFSNSASFTSPPLSTTPSFSPSRYFSNDPSRSISVLTPEHRRFSVGTATDSTSAAAFTLFLPHSLANGDRSAEGSGSGSGHSLQTPSLREFEVEESAEALLALRRGHNSQIKARWITKHSEL